MMFYDFEAGGKNYKLRLTTRNIVSLEKQLNCNPLAIFGDGDTIPTVSAMVSVLFHSAQQYNHNVSLNDAYDIFDAYLADGHSLTDFIAVILEIYKVSGLINTGKVEENAEKN